MEVHEDRRGGGVERREDIDDEAVDVTRCLGLRAADPLGSLEDAVPGSGWALLLETTLGSFVKHYDFRDYELLIL